jgi:hypothetical protein
MSSPEIKVRGRGRPKKGEIVAKTPKNRGVIGRPKGDKAILDEYKARMLNSPKSARVLETILDAALDDQHKNQAVAWKLVVDRIMPVSSFDQVKQSGSMPSISINISSIGQPVIETLEDVSDTEYRDVE